MSTAQGAGWVGQSTPNPDFIVNSMSGVSCATANACEAVGFGFQAGWDGTAWTDQGDVTAESGQLNAVSCPRGNVCEAVGTANGGITAARWDGTSWTLQALPAGSGVSAISCPTVRFCMAVGGNAAESWNGTTWTLRPPVNLGGLSGVSCTASDACTAVGSTGADPLIERWNGTGWSVQSLSGPTGASTELLGVSCIRAQLCRAVGDAGYPNFKHTPFSAQWRGGAWHVTPTETPGFQPAPDFHGSAELTSVSCHTARFCIAVGARFQLNFNAEVVFAERWTNGGWQLMPGPFADGFAGVPTGAISCPTLTRCEAVGTFASGGSTAVSTAGAGYYG